MSNGFAAVDLSSLPAPQVVEPLDFETVLAALKADFEARHPDYTATLESDPAMKLLEVAAYREVIVRQRVNDAAKAVMLAFATGSDLDHLGALVPVARNAGETDASYRGRIQLAPEAFSTAGPQLGYIWHALSATADIKDVTAVSPSPGDVVVTVLSRHGDGGPAAIDVLETETVTLDPAATVKAVDGASAIRVKMGSTVLARGVDYLYDPASRSLSRIAAGDIPAGSTVTVEHVSRGEVELVSGQLSARLVRPLTDHVTVQPATILTYAVTATIWISEGPAGELVRQAAIAAAEAYAESRHRLGADVTISGFEAALHVEGVWKAQVLIDGTAEDLVTNTSEAGWCSGITVTVGGVE